MTRMAAGTHKGAEEHRLARHAKRCHDCRRRAREMGIEPLTTLGTLRQKAAALLPIPWLFRRSGDAGGTITGLFSTARTPPRCGTRRCPRGGGRAGGCGRRGARKWSAPRGPRDGRGRPSRGRALHDGQGGSQRGTAGHAADGERAGARRASGRRAGPAGGRAGGSGDSLKQPAPATQAPAGGSAGPNVRTPLQQARCRSSPTTRSPRPRPIRRDWTSRRRESRYRRPGRSRRSSSRRCRSRCRAPAT
jgi:hypothetical protein